MKAVQNWPPIPYDLRFSKQSSFSPAIPLPLLPTRFSAASRGSMVESQTVGFRAGLVLNPGFPAHQQTTERPPR